MTKNFKVEEFECKCGCKLAKPSPALLLVLQWARDYFDRPITITSGSRCHMHNTNVGGARSSQHLIKDDGCTHAADIKIEGMDPEMVYAIIDEEFPNMLGLGLYKSWVHVDDRISQAYRWG